MFDPKTDLKQLRAFQTEIRKVVRQSQLTRAHKSVLIAIVDLWWGKNKTANTARGLGQNLTPIHPGMAKIARKSGVCIRTAKRAFLVIKRLNIAKVVEHEKGGKHAARIVLCFHHILALEGASKTDLYPCQMSPLTGDAMSHGYKDIIGKEETSQGAVILPFRALPVKERSL